MWNQQLGLFEEKDKADLVYSRGQTFLKMVSGQL